MLVIGWSSVTTTIFCVVIVVLVLLAGWGQPFQGGGGKKAKGGRGLPLTPHAHVCSKVSADRHSRTCTSPL
jgi:hypothetical protein